MPVPQLIDAGTTTKFTYLDGRYSPSNGWVMTLYLTGQTALQIVAVANGGEFDFTIDANRSANLPQGLMRWKIRASNTNTGEVYPVSSGVLEVRPDVSQQTSDQINEEKILGYIQNHISLRLSGDAAVDMVSIDNRMLRLMTMNELRTMEAEYMERISVIRHRRTSKYGFTKVVV